MRTRDVADSESSDGDYDAGTNRKVLPGSAAHFSAPNFTQQYDMEAKVRAPVGPISHCFRIQIKINKFSFLSGRSRSCSRAIAPIVEQSFLSEFSIARILKCTLHHAVTNLTIKFTSSRYCVQGRVAGKKQQVIFERPFKRKTRASIMGWLLMIIFTGAFTFYMYARAAHTLNLGPKYEW